MKVNVNVEVDLNRFPDGRHNGTVTVHISPTRGEAHLVFPFTVVDGRPKLKSSSPVLESILAAAIDRHMPRYVLLLARWPKPFRKLVQVETERFDLLREDADVLNAGGMTPAASMHVDALMFAPEVVMSDDEWQAVPGAHVVEYHLDAGVQATEPTP